MPNYVFAVTKCEKRSPLVEDYETISTADATLATATCGDLVLIATLEGYYHGVALNDYDDNTDTLVLDLQGAYDLPVTAIDGSGNQAIVVGDWLYFNATASRIDLVRSDTGHAIGQALEAVTSGADATIAVRLRQVPPDKTLAA